MRKVRQVCDGGRRRRRTSRETVRSETSTPSLPQFPVNARGSPEGIRRAHLRDERPNGGTGAGAADASGRGAPGPPATEAIADASGRRCPAATTISAVRQSSHAWLSSSQNSRSRRWMGGRGRALEHRQLLTECQVLKRDRAMSAADQRQRPEQKENAASMSHPVALWSPRSTGLVADPILANHTGARRKRH